jgi:hypothetical protein
MIDPLLPHASGPTLSRRTLRQFAGLCVLFFGGLAAWQGWGRESWRWAAALGAIGLVIGVAGLLRPLSVRPLFKGALALARPIGWLVSNLLLSLLFFVVFVPIGLLFRLLGRDPLSLRRPADRETYLIRRPDPPGPRSYFRQS